jgi:transcriptional regulator with XRE-family HTH domain
MEFQKVAYYDTVGVIMSTIELQIMNLIKNKAREAHLTQQRVASELRVSLATVKRWWAGKGVQLGSLNRLCGLIGVSLSQLLVEIEANASTYTYSLEQEKVLAQHPRVLALFDLLVSGKTAKFIQSKYSFSDDEMFSMLVKLDRVGLIELHEKNRVKLKQTGEPQWIVGGPLSLKYRKRMIESLLGEHVKTEMSFYIHDYLPEDVILLRAKIKELENLMHACNVRGGLKPESATSFGSYICFKQFEWDLREVLGQ